MDDAAAVGGLEINCEALFAALNAEQDTELRPAHRIAAVLFDLDHAGAEVSKQAVGKRPGHVSAEIKHENAIKRTDPRRDGGGGGGTVDGLVAGADAVGNRDPRSGGVVREQHRAVLARGWELAPERDW